MAMATPVLLTSGNESFPGTLRASASIAPPANVMIFAAFLSVKNFAVAAAPTVSGLGLTWTQVATQVYAVGSARVSLFRAYSGTSAPTAGQVTFTTASQNSGTWVIFYVPALVMTGTNGADSVVQAVTDADASSVPEVTLAAFASSANGTIGVFAESPGPTTPGSGFTELADVASTSDYLQVQYKTVAATTVDNGQSSDFWAGIALELKARAPYSYAAAIL